MKLLNLFSAALMLAGATMITSCGSDERGCTNSDALNYDSQAEEDDGTCIVAKGCTDADALNYDADAKDDNGTCIYSNVSSHNITVNENDWNEISAGFEATKSLTEITSDILDNGLIASYIVRDNEHEPLPYSTYIGSQINKHYNYSITEGEITFEIKWADGIRGNKETLNYKVVVISDKSAASELNINTDDYDDVASTLSLK